MRRQMLRLMMLLLLLLELTMLFSGVSKDVAIGDGETSRFFLIIDFRIPLLLLLMLLLLLLLLLLVLLGLSW